MVVKEPDYIFKILIIGDMFVGKTSIMFRFTENNFQETYKPTIPIDFKSVMIQLNRKWIQLEIW
jgi:GTPase SAR1 family protein